jgi:hypothetical protein
VRSHRLGSDFAEVVGSESADCNDTSLLATNIEVVLPASINGCGTTWYGASDRGEDGSYVVTEWIVFLFIPLIPLGSKRVWPMPKEQKPWWKASVGKQFKVTRAPMNWSQVLKGYGVTAAIVLICRLYL